MVVADPTNENRYFGIRDYVNGGYDGLLLQQFKDGGLTLFYMSKTGWVEDNALIEDLHDSDTRPITAAEAEKVAKARFGQTL